MPTANEKYEAALLKRFPHMKDYMSEELVIVPYLFRAHRDNIRCDSFSTDRLRFRRSIFKNEIIDCDSWYEYEHKALLLGGDTAFGIGTSDDGKTLASRLGDNIGMPVLNLGMAQANSSQEVTAGQYFLKDCETVIIFSGYNNLSAALYGSCTRAPFAPELDEAFVDLMSRIPVRDIVLTTTSGLGDRRISGAGNAKPLPDVQDAGRACRIAMEAYHRDLVVIQKFCSPTARIIFALQPTLFAILRTPDLVEVELISALRLDSGDKEANIWEHQFPDILPDYALGIAKVCKSLGIGFIDLNTCSFDGLCFLGPSWMTDRGNQLAARHIGEHLN